MRDKAAVIGAAINARHCVTNHTTSMYVTQLHYTRFYLVTISLPTPHIQKRKYVLANESVPIPMSKDGEAPTVLGMTQTAFS